MCGKVSKVFSKEWALKYIVFLFFVGIAFEVLAVSPINSLNQSKGGVKDVAVEIIEDGETIMNIDGEPGNYPAFKIFVPADTLYMNVRTMGGTGNCDLYVWHESCEDLQKCSYTSEHDGNNEMVSLIEPTSGWWYIWLWGRKTYNDVGLVADYVVGIEEIPQLLDGMELTSLSGIEDTWQFFKIYVPNGQALLNVYTMGGTGDCDLYVWHEPWENMNSLQESNNISTNYESITCLHPLSGWWIVGLRAYWDYSEASLIADYVGIDEITVLTDGEEVVTSLPPPYDTWQLLKINVPAGQALLDVSTWGGTGNCDLYVWYESCEDDNCEYVSKNDDNNERVGVFKPNAGWWIIALHGISSGVSLLANCIGIDEISELSDGVEINSLSGTENSWQLFKINVPPDQAVLDIRTWGGSGNCDLYAWHESCEDWNCINISSSLNNTETIWKVSPESGWWCIAISGDYNGVNLMANYINIDDISELTDEVEVSNLYGDKGSIQLFKINVPPDQAVLDIRTWGGSGNCDLYAWHESCEAVECIHMSVNETNNEEIVVNNPAAGWWIIGLNSVDSYIVVNLLADYSGAVDDITDGELVSSISTWKLYLINVPTAQELLWIHTWGGTGNCDLVAYSASCQTSDCYYSSSNSGNDEQIVISNPTSGWWYIGVFGFDFSGVNLIADYVSGSEIVEVSDEEIQGSLSGVQFSPKYFKINVPDSQARLGAYTWGGSGNCDLYGSYASCTTSDCRFFSSNTGNSEQGVKNNPEGGWWYIVLFGTGSYNGVSLLTDYFSAEEITDGEVVTPLSGNMYSVKYYMINVPAGQVQLDIHTWGGTDNCELYAYHQSCTTAGCSYKSENTGNDEQILLTNPEGGWWYIVVYGAESFDGVSLTASYTKEITNGEVVTPLSADEGIFQYFKIYIPTRQSRLEVSTWGGTGDCKLYVRYGRSGCSLLVSSSEGNEEKIVVNSPIAGWWYVSLYATKGYNNVSLTANYFIAEELTDGERVGPLSGATGSTQYFMINVPEGQSTLKVKTWGGTGNCDLLVYHESCRVKECEYSSSNSGNDERLAIDNPYSGWWYIVLYSVRNTYSGVYLIADYSVSIEGEGVLEGEGIVEGTPEGIPEGVIEGTPEGTPEGVVEGTPEGTPEGEGIVEGTPEGTTEGEGIFEGSVEGEGLAEGEGEAIQEIFDEQTVGPLSGVQSSYQYFKINVPAGQTLLDIRIWGGTGDCDLWAYHESCQSSECIYISLNIGNNDEVIVNNPIPGWWYITLHAYEAYSGVYLIADYSVSVEGEGVLEGEGIVEGTPEGTPEGVIEGTPEGTPEGVVEGTPEGTSEGTVEGTMEGEYPHHSADQNGDGQINLSELLRVIQFFNYLGYHCEAGTEDGYAPGLDGDHTCNYHASDYNPKDWVIDLSELLRLIQFFNMGGYHPCPEDPESEDGYCPGP